MMTHPTAHPLDAARALTARGWVVFPGDRPDTADHCMGSPRACRERTCGADRDPSKRGKHPAVVERWGELREPADDATLVAWFGDEHPRWNVLLACGPSGLVVIDDDAAGGLERYAESIGEKVPETFRVSAVQGDHYYFAAPVGPDGARLALGNSAGLLDAWGCDVRGGASASGVRGGYVATGGSQHWTGRDYRVTDWAAPVADLPAWLIEAIRTPAGPCPPRRGVGGGGTGAGSGERGASLTGDARWDDEPRYGSADELAAQFQRHCAEVAHEGGAFRHELFLAARDGWRLVNLGLCAEDAMLAELDGCVHRVWAAEPDHRDEKIVMVEALHAARRSPWELTLPERVTRAAEHHPVIQPGRSFLTTSEAATRGLTSGDETVDRTTHGNPAVVDIDGASPPEVVDSAFEALPLPVRNEVGKRDTRTAADLYIAHRDANKVRDITAAEFFAMPPPRYLVPGLVHRDGIAVLFGAPHSGKSFLALDVALSLASGKPWAGGEGKTVTLPDGAPGVVHYIMAEAPGTNIGRGNAWLAYHGLTVADLGGRFHPILDAFLLTKGGIAGYLPKLVRERPDLIIYDTRSAMFEGKESQGEDYAEMLRAMRTIREVNDKECAQLALDHTGLGAPDRPRGNNAWEAGTDSMILIEKDKDTGLHRVTPKRVRNERESDAEWGFRRETVVVDGRSEAVLAPVALTGHRPFVTESSVLTSGLDDGIRDAIDQATLPDGKAAPAKREAKWIMLIMLAAADADEGHTQGDLRAIISAHTGKTEKSIRGSVSDAVTTLVRLGMVERIARGRVLLMPAFRPGAD